MKLLAAHISKALGISRQAVQQEIKLGNLIRQSNYLIDTEDKINADWLRRRGLNHKLQSEEEARKEAKAHEEAVFAEKVRPKINNVGAKKEFKSGVNPDLTPVEASRLMGIPERLLGLTLMQVCVQYGGVMGLKSYVDILNTLMSAAKRDVELQEKKRQLIEKDFVLSHVFQFIDTIMNQMFDYPESVIDEIISIVKTDESKAREKIPVKIQADIGKIIKNNKKMIIKEIENARKKRHTEEMNGQQEFI